MKTSRTLRAVRAHWVVVLVVAIIGLLGGLGRAALAAPSYSSTASLLISVADPDEGAQQNYQSTVASTISDSMNTYLSLATSGVVLNEVDTRLGLGGSVPQLAGRIHANVPLSTSIVEVTATGDDADSAARLANTTVAVLGDEIVDSGMKQGSGAPALRTVIIQDGADAVVETGPNPLVGSLIGLLVGLAVGVIIALVVESAQRRDADDSVTRHGAHQLQQQQEVIEFS